MRLVSSGDYDAGECSSACGDYSLGAEPSNRAVWEVRPGLFVAVTETYSVTARRDSDAYDMTPDDLEEALEEIRAWEAAPEDTRGPEPETVRYSVDEQTEWLLFTDQGDPGGTELASDYDYGPGSVLYYGSLEAAEEEARRWARVMFDPENYAPENWAPVRTELAGGAA